MIYSTSKLFLSIILKLRATHSRIRSWDLPRPQQRGHYVGHSKQLFPPESRPPGCDLWSGRLSAKHCSGLAVDALLSAHTFLCVCVGVCDLLFSASRILALSLRRTGQTWWDCKHSCNAVNSFLLCLTCLCLLSCLGINVQMFWWTRCKSISMESSADRLISLCIA